MAHSKNKSRNTPYRERSTRPSRQPGNMMDDRNNNMAATNPRAKRPDVERANDPGIGDAAVNDKKMTRYRSNRSADA